MSVRMQVIGAELYDADGDRLTVGELEQPTRDGRTFELHARCTTGRDVYLNATPSELLELGRALVAMAERHLAG